MLLSSPVYLHTYSIDKIFIYNVVYVCIVLPSANSIREISSGYPTNVYDGKRLLLPILRKKMALSHV
jgi:hypothetical protein